MARNELVYEARGLAVRRWLSSWQRRAKQRRHGLLLRAASLWHAECVLASVWMRPARGRHVRARVLNGGWLVGYTLVEVGGRGGICG